MGFRDPRAEVISNYWLSRFLDPSAVVKVIGINICTNLGLVVCVAEEV